MDYTVTHVGCSSISKLMRGSKQIVYFFRLALTERLMTSIKYKHFRKQSLLSIIKRQDFAAFGKFMED